MTDVRPIHASIAGRELEVVADMVNEQMIIASALAGWDDGVADKLLRVFGPDHFLAPEHAAFWGIVREMRARKLGWNPVTARTIGGGTFDDDLSSLVAQIGEHHPFVPENLDFHVEQMLWDRSKATALTGPITALLEAIKDPKSDPERIHALSRQVPAALRSGERKHLLDPKQLVHSQIAQIRARRDQNRRFVFGIDGLDYFESHEAAKLAGIVDPEKIAGPDGRVRRMLPGAEPGYITLISTQSGGGKALALDTPIATSRGWTTMGEIRVGDEVFDENGEVCRVLHCSPVMRDHDCYRVDFSDGASIVADADHLWFTKSAVERSSVCFDRRDERVREEKRRSGKKLYPKMSAGLIRRHAESGLKHPREGSIRTTAQIAEAVYVQTSAGPRVNHAIEVARPLVLPEIDLPIPPYVLGAWLGDGTSSNSGFTNHVRDEAIVRLIEANGFDVRKQKHSIGNQLCTWTILGLKVKLRAVGVLDNKHIPAVYLRSSIAQRLELLRGLMDTDGYCAKEGKCNFDSANPKLVAGVSELLTSLGIKANPVARRMMLRGRDVGTSWRFVFTTHLPVFALERKLRRMKAPVRGVHARRFIVAVEKVQSVPVRCIMVDSPSHLYLAGRAMIPTHNTSLATALTLALARQKRRVLYCAWEPKAGITLESLAVQSLGWSRTRVLQGQVTDDQLLDLERRMAVIAKWVRFMTKEPFYDFGGGKKKRTNQQNLDTFAAYVADSGCDAVIADLWKYCLVSQEPSEEEEALKYQQAMCEDLRFHLFLLQQQTHKRFDMRSDKRPSREGVKGSGTYLEIVDNFLAPNIPSLWKPGIPVDRFEVFVLKQRYGRWPIGIEFEWDSDSGRISGGTTIPYDFDVKDRRDDDKGGGNRPRSGRGGSFNKPNSVDAMPIPADGQFRDVQKPAAPVQDPKQVATTRVKTAGKGIKSSKNIDPHAGGD